MSSRQPVGDGRRWWRVVNAPLLAAALATALSVLLYAGEAKKWWTVPGLEELELSTIDARFRLRGEREPRSDEIVIVGIDDRTRQEFPEVFQARRGHARLIDALSDYQPRAIGLDLFYSSPEVTLSPETVEQVREAARAFGAQIGPRTPAGDRALEALEAVVEETRGDQLLAEAVEDSGRVFLGVLVVLPEPGQAPARDVEEPPDFTLARYGEAVDIEAPPSRRPPQGAHAIGSLDPIARGAAGAGAVNVLEDLDGRVRRVPLVLDHGGRFYMPLGMSLALTLTGGDSSYVVGEESVGFGSVRAPVNPRGQAFLAHLGPNETFPRISAADVLAGRAPRAALEGKLAFVGFTDVARDKVATPFDTQLDGVAIHATLAHNLLHGELLEQTGPGTTLLTLIGLGGLLTLAQLRRIRQRRAWVVGAVAIVSIFGYLAAAHLLFARAGLIVEVAAPLGAAVFISMVALITSLVTEGRAKRQLRAAFEQYVSETLVERIVTDMEHAELTLGGERRELTVLFSDIRGFSRFSERLEPEVLSAYLNEYLTPMTDVVMQADGLLDKYIGDAIMAVYGAPLEMTDHADHACKTALEMKRRLAPLNESWRGRDLPEIQIGVGINTGPMSVGNMGSDMRFDYTVMGDAVNLAARLEALTKAYGVDILCGEETAGQASDRYVFREIDLVRVVGRDKPARVFELLGERGHTRMDEADLEVWNQALDAYRARDWAAARAGFDQIIARFPADGPSHVLRERVSRLEADPPPEDWDGVYAQVSK